MPDGWSFNPWNLSPWAADPPRDAARDTAMMGGGAAAPSLADVIQPAVPVRSPEEYDPADWYASLIVDWPNVASLIPPAQQVTSADRQEVIDWTNASLGRDPQRTDVQCFHFAARQMYLAGYRVSGPPARDAASILVIQERRQPGGPNIPELQLDESVRAVSYLKQSLADGVPVMIGVKIEGYGAEPNNIWGTPYVIATDHFVVVVGTGVDETGVYFTYFDYLSNYDANKRLYLTPLLLIESDSIGYRMIEMRRSSPRLTVRPDAP